jgi:predicted RNase H-like nuclease (RuvC/YqgF family)
MSSHSAMEVPGREGYLQHMDTETRAAITAMGDMILARMDHYFELRQAQHLELRAGSRGDFRGLRDEVRDLRDQVDALTERVTGLEHQVAQLRDYVTREIGEIRLELRELRSRVDQNAELRREVAELTARVDRLEQRQSDQPRE